MENDAELTGVDVLPTSGWSRVRGRLRFFGDIVSPSTIREYGIVVSFLAMFITLSVSSNVFLERANLSNMVNQTAPTGLMAVGSTLVFIAGGFDLSIGAVFAIAGVIAAKAVPTIGPTPAILLGAMSGLGFGVINGLLVTVGRINAFIATLGSQFLIYGVSAVFTGGLLIAVSNPSFSDFGSGAFLGLQFGAWTWLACALAAGFILTRTTFGRYIFASGGNREAAKLSGVRVNLVKTITFALSGFSASLAGVLVASQVATGQGDSGMDIPFTVVAGIVIGGVSIFGGEGAIWRSILGVLFLTMIGNGFVLLGINAIYTQIFQGAIILLAVAVDAWSRRRE